ncbi:MAG: cell division protein FtsL [Bacillota bacterium]|nr:cell division protein FtsL [Bacillota bacterium]
MSVNESNYVYGSTARQLDYDINTIFEEKKRPSVKKHYRTNNKARTKAIFFTLALFAACFAIMIRYSIITEMNYQVSSVNQKYEDIKSKNSVLKVDIERATDLNRIREIAETRLGMQKPDKFQVVYVNIPKQDFTEVAENYKDAKKSDNIFAALLDDVGKLAHILD